MVPVHPLGQIPASAHPFCQLVYVFHVPIPMENEIESAMLSPLQWWLMLFCLFGHLYTAFQLKKTPQSGKQSQQYKTESQPKRLRKQQSNTGVIMKAQQLGGGGERRGARHRKVLKSILMLSIKVVLQSFLKTGTN